MLDITIILKSLLYPVSIRWMLTGLIGQAAISTASQTQCHSLTKMFSFLKRSHHELKNQNTFKVQFLMRTGSPRLQNFRW